MIVVDLSDITFIDSTGVRELVVLNSDLSGPPRRSCRWLRRVLDVSSLAQLVPTSTTVEHRSETRRRRMD